jgi:hypothetical protein
MSTDSKDRASQYAAEWELLKISCEPLVVREIESPSRDTTTPLTTVGGLALIGFIGWLFFWVLSRVAS